MGAFQVSRHARQAKHEFYSTPTKREPEHNTADNLYEDRESKPSADENVRAAHARTIDRSLGHCADAR